MSAPEGRVDPLDPELIDGFLLAAALQRLHRIRYYIERLGMHPDAIGMTPLHYAAMGGCDVCLARLVSEGAQINRRNRCGETPLASAACRARSRQSAGSRYECREAVGRVVSRAYCSHHSR